MYIILTSYLVHLNGIYLYKQITSFLIFIDRITILLFIFFSYFLFNEIFIICFIIFILFILSYFYLGIFCHFMKMYGYFSSLFTSFSLTPNRHPHSQHNLWIYIKLKKKNIYFWIPNNKNTFVKRNQSIK